jgi:hypothetical protein
VIFPAAIYLKVRDIIVAFIPINVMHDFVPPKSPPYTSPSKIPVDEYATIFESQITSFIFIGLWSHVSLTCHTRERRSELTFFPWEYYLAKQL